MGTGPGPKPGGAHFEPMPKPVARNGPRTHHHALCAVGLLTDRAPPPAGAVAQESHRAKYDRRKHARGCIITSACVRGKKGVKKRQLGASSDKKREKSRKKRPKTPYLS